jgi:hypothetical protein
VGEAYCLTGYGIAPLRLQVFSSLPLGWGSLEHERHEKHEIGFLFLFRVFFVFRVQENEVVGFIPVILEELAILLDLAQRSMIFIFKNFVIFFSQLTN